MIKILANDGIDPIGKKILEDAGFVVDTETVPQDQLVEALKTMTVLLLEVQPNYVRI